MTSCDGTVLASGIGSTFVDGFGPVNETVCLKNAQSGLAVEVGGGEFIEDVSWSIAFPSGYVKTGGADSWIGLCISAFPTPQPSLSPMPTPACENYAVELYDAFGDG